MYSLGALLYELLTGSTPLEDLDKASYVETLRRIREQAIEPPSVRLLRPGNSKKTAELRQTGAAKLPKLLAQELD